MVKNLPANAGDLRDSGLIHGLGRSPGGEHGNPLRYSCLENPMDRGAWQATVHRVAKSWTKVGVYIFAPPDSQLPWEGRDLPQVAQKQCSVGIISFVGLCSAIKKCSLRPVTCLQKPEG